MSLDDDAITNLVASAGAPELRRVCALLHLDNGGNDDAKKGRLLSFLAGPPSRRRRNWLLLALRAGIELQLEPDDEMDNDSFESDDYEGVDVLQDYRCLAYHLTR